MCLVERARRFYCSSKYDTDAAKKDFINRYLAQCSRSEGDKSVVKGNSCCLLTEAVAGPRGMWISTGTDLPLRKIVPSGSKSTNPLASPAVTESTATTPLENRAGLLGGSREVGCCWQRSGQRGSTEECADGGEHHRVKYSQLLARRPDDRFPEVSCFWVLDGTHVGSETSIAPSDPADIDDSAPAPAPASKLSCRSTFPADIKRAEKAEAGVVLGEAGSVDNILHGSACRPFRGP